MSGLNGGVALFAAVMVALNSAAMVILASAGEATRFCTALCRMDQRDLAVRSGLYVAGAMARTCCAASPRRTATFAVGPHKLEVLCEAASERDQASAPPDRGTPHGPGTSPSTEAFSATVILDGQQALTCVVESSGGILSVKDLRLWPSPGTSRPLGR